VSVVIPVASSVAALNIAVGTPQNGQLGIVRIGSGADAQDIELVWNAARSKWVEAGEGFVCIRSTDQAPCRIPSSFTTLQYMGSGDGGFVNYWGTSSPHNVDAALDAGLTLEYRQSGWLQQGASVDVAISALLYEQPDGGAVPAAAFTKPPTGFAAQTSELVGGGSGVNFEQVRQGWTPLAVTINTPAFYAVAAGRMVGSTSSGGGFVDYELVTRYVG
jgi:hypothetical protein